MTILLQTSDSVSFNLSFLVGIGTIFSILGAFLLYVLNSSNNGVRKALKVRNAIIRLRDFILYSNQVQDLRIDSIEAFLAKQFDFHSRQMPNVPPPDLNELADDDGKK